MDYGTFTTSVLGSGLMGLPSTVIYKRLASLPAEKHAQSYHKTMSWMHAEFLHAEIIHHMHSWVLFLNQQCLQNGSPQ